MVPRHVQLLPQATKPWQLTRNGDALGKWGLRPLLSLYFERDVMNSTIPKPISKVEVWSLREIINLSSTKKMNPDPIGQRPPVTSNNEKSLSILRGVINGYGLGCITLRDIRAESAEGTAFVEDSAQARKIYPNYDFLVGDAGHRIRALVAFYKGDLQVDGIMFGNMDDEEFSLDAEDIPVILYTCTAKQFSEVVRNVNTTTPVNFMEMVMLDDVTPVLKDIRSTVKFYKEYNNEINPLFKTTFSNPKQKWIADHFGGDPNPRRKWDEWVAIAIIKARGGGNENAGQPEIEQLANDTQEVSKSKLDVVARMLNDALKIRQDRGRKWDGGNSSEFSAFMLFWFGLYNVNKDFVINDYIEFAKAFFTAYRKLSNKDIEQIVKINGVKVIKTKWFKKNVSSFAQGDIQQICFNFMQDQMELELTDEGVKKIGVIFRDKVRSKSKDGKEQALINQGYVCALDDLALTLEDSVWGHNIAWAKGGKLEDGAVIRKCHNTDMGSTTLSEYKKLLQDRKKAA